MSDWQDRPLSMLKLAALLADPAERAAAGVRSVTTLADGGRYARRAAEFSDPGAGFAACRQAFQPLAQDYDPAVVAALRGAVVVGQGAVVTRNGTLIHDSVRAMIGPERLVDGLADVGGRFQVVPSRVVAVPQPALLLQSAWWRNYGHWLFDSAALLALAAGYARRHRLALVLGRHADPAMRAVVEETLALLLPEAEVILHDDGEALEFNELHYAAPVSVTPLFKQPDAIALLRRAVAPASAAPRRRLYVRRPPELQRLLVNEAEVIDLCTARGCEVVQPERLGLRAQAALFAAAELVVGVKGAALSNLMFAPEHATAVVLSPRHWIDPIFWDLAGQRDQRYIEVLADRTDPDRADPDGADPNGAEGGAADPRAPLRVDLAALTRALDAAETGQPVPPADPGRGECALPDMPGADYRDCLRLVHAVRTPRTYLEIGCLDGETLALARCPAIGIDPAFEPRIAIGREAPAVFLFQMPSDDFFARHDPTRLLGQAIDLAFIDGLHLVENVLRDFINVERCCSPGSMIVIHDCVPLDRHMACRDQNDTASRNRSRHPAFWTGDVWKILPILAQFRPDLEVRVFNAPPTGMALVRRLDPANRTLAREYARIVAAFCQRADEAQLFRAVIGGLRLSDTGALADWLNGR